MRRNLKKNGRILNTIDRYVLAQKSIHQQAAKIPHIQPIFSKIKYKIKIIFEENLRNTFLYPEITQTRNRQRKSTQIFVSSIKSISNQKSMFSLLKCRKIFHYNSTTFFNLRAIVALVKITHLKNEN